MQINKKMCIVKCKGKNVKIHLNIVTGSHLTALLAKADPVEYRNKESSSIQTATVTQLLSHLTHDNAGTEIGAATC